jgi:hypothetical protein
MEGVPVLDTENINVAGTLSFLSVILFHFFVCKISQNL